MAIVILLLLLVPVLAVAAWLMKPQCPNCSARALRYLHARKDGGADGRYSFNPQLCSACGWSSHQAIEPEFRPITVTFDAPAMPTPPSDEQIIFFTLKEMEAQAGPVTRKRALENGLARLADPAARERLLVEASKVEVSAVLAKVATLKTKEAKRKRLVQALAEIRSDDVDDALQAAEVALLERALARIDEE